MEVSKKSFLSVREMCEIALSVALIAVCSWISLPLGPVPFTLQTFAVFVVAGLLGFKRGLCSVVVYILLGAVGVPVGAGFAGGIGWLLGTTGGYIVGFLFTAAALGALVHFFGRRLWALLLGMVVGLALCYTFGTIWFLRVYTAANGAVALSTVLGWCVIPYLIPDACKIALAAVLVNRLSRVLKV